MDPLFTFRRLLPSDDAVGIARGRGETKYWPELVKECVVAPGLNEWRYRDLSFQQGERNKIRKLQEIGVSGIAKNRVFDDSIGHNVPYPDASWPITKLTWYVIEGAKPPRQLRDLLFFTSVEDCYRVAGRLESTDIRLDSVKETVQCCEMGVLGTIVEPPQRQADVDDLDRVGGDEIETLLKNYSSLRNPKCPIGYTITAMAYKGSRVEFRSKFNPVGRSKVSAELLYLL